LLFFFNYLKSSTFAKCICEIHTKKLSINYKNSDSYEKKRHTQICTLTIRHQWLPTDLIHEFVSDAKSCLPVYTNFRTYNQMQN